MIWFACLLVVSGPFAAGAAGPSLEIVVTSPEGVPLPGIPVLQAQLERPSISVEAIGETGADGHLLVNFEGRPAERDGDRGYGVYRFLLAPEDRPWALSDLYIWSVEGSPIAGAEWYLKLFDYREPDNWNYGQRQVLASGQNLTWKVSPPESREVRILVKDDWGLDVAEASVRVLVDLGALSHTGFGAEVSVGSFKTDERGVFTLPNAGDFVYSFEIQNGRHIAPHPHYLTSVLPMRLRGEHAILVYHRRITVPLKLVVSDSKTGHPIAGASVSHVIHFPTATQGGLIGVTDEHGVFATDSFSPEHTAYIRVQAPGYADRDVSYSAGQSEYLVTLAPLP
ncbi:MAG: carboxypeptidase regulatory-like domain-containing protein [Candidatus Hydrogenedentes bacterium]|nr:carboxypeptidase regulatory-like domain-containing protein [Candidatus Hydrogenedentota bacterium]